MGNLKHAPKVSLGQRNKSNVSTLDLGIHHQSGLQQSQRENWSRGHWCKGIQAVKGIKSLNASNVLLKSSPSFGSRTRRCEELGYGLVFRSKSSNHEVALK